ncbi:hypothetical protein Acsp04_13710 [Actinomadura sp. NBRC 104425]|nr:hypothetical protein Acsp04_13710 [Actinomadura sp. NBRC 104425]
MPKAADRTVGIDSVTTRRPPGSTVRFTGPEPSLPGWMVWVVPGSCALAARVTSSLAFTRGGRSGALRRVQTGRPAEPQAYWGGPVGHDFQRG